MTVNISGDTGVSAVQSGAIEATDIPNNTITADKLHTTLDLSSKTITLDTPYINNNILLHKTGTYSNLNFYDTSSTLIGNMSSDATGVYLEGRNSNPLRFYTNSSEKMRIDASGNVTVPAQPCFSAYHPYNINYNAYTTPIVFSGVRFNNGNHYNSSTGQFTAPVSGKYLMNCYLHFMGESSYTFIFSRFRQSGTSVGIEMMRGSARSDYDVFGMSTILDLSANDTVDVVVIQSGVDSGYLRGGTSFNKFEGYLIG